MKKRIATGVSACMLLAGMLQAEIVVSAGRVPTAAEDVSSSVSTVTAAELERWQVQTLPEALQMLPGVHLTRNGGLGQRAAIFVRGTDGDRVLVLVDGIEINDPSSTGRRADLTMLNATDIERVEVLRGSQSALYGADAMGGVINIVTKRGEGPTSFSLLGEAGSFKTWRGAASLSGATGIVDYAVSVTRVESEGISAANEADGNTEKDGYDWTAVSARVGIAPLENLSVDLVARYTDTSADYDAGAGEGGDAEGNVADTESILLGGTIKLGLLDSTWQQAVSASVASHDREFVSGWGNNWFDSEVAKAGWQHDVYLNDANVLTAGIEVEAEKAETDGLPEVDSAVRRL